MNVVAKARIKRRFRLEHERRAEAKRQKIQGLETLIETWASLEQWDLVAKLEKRLRMLKKQLKYMGKE